MSGSTERMPRLLALVPYLLARPGIKIEQAAQDFDVSAKQLRKDLELLWMCGLPGYGPGDLIDLSFDGDTVSVTFDAGMRRPLRLTGGEASALVIALRALGETPGVVDTDAVRRAIAKIEAAAGDAQPAGVVVGMGVREREATARTREVVREALQEGRALRMRYYTASKDEVSDRTVDPMRLLIVQANSYLEAWCRRAGAVRLFRLDRVDELEVLDEPADPPAEAEPREVSAGVFAPHEDYPEAVLVLEPDVRWIAEYYPCEELAELDGGRLRVRMRYGDESWMVRLVLGRGEGVHVESPESLAQAVRQRAADALARARHLPVTYGQ
ncbi:protein pafC [Prauserella sp. PE36]|uniref:YafY family transcriptional regulator n=1 Tax=Prauserella endophytica TaxID=1592324 RepID=A0ABY2S6F7_9PSEU|nr:MULTISPECIES: YafY family protein [Prauserella]PXY30214.1 protein pafC [Prauserella coralliicola]RBM22671.1 protein pafC [Prauserella sp. PE36]TKG71283.1 YafY family transcriptional regulator [Prauserella endophytica]